MSGDCKNTFAATTRAIQRDRRLHQPTLPPAAELEDRLRQLLVPAIELQRENYRRLGLRERTLTLPAMAALVISLIWRQFGSISEAVRLLSREGLLWTERLKVSRQAACDRLRELPAVLFHNAFDDVAATVLYRAEQRYERVVEHLKPHLRFAHEMFVQVNCVDASTLDALQRKLQLLAEAPGTPLGGRMVALLDVLCKMPRTIWYDADSMRNEHHFWQRIIDAVPAGSLTIIDLGFLSYRRFEQMAAAGKWMLSRAKKDVVAHVLRTLRDDGAIRDLIVHLGSGTSRIRTPMRMIEAEYRGARYRYLTNLLDAEQYPAEHLVALYRERWSIETAFGTVKRLLGLSYFHSCSSNAIELQLWSTWMLYSALIDLRHEVAEKLDCPVQRISIEMLYRSLYYFNGAYLRGEADDLVVYLANNAKSLGILMPKRRKQPRPRRSAVDALLHFDDDP